MPIKYTTTNKKPQCHDFPKLMCAKGAAYGDRLIILAAGYTDETKRNMYGTVICSDKSNSTGHYRDDWVATAFVDWLGSITLENE